MPGGKSACINAVLTSLIVDLFRSKDPRASDWFDSMKLAILITFLFIKDLSKPHTVQSCKLNKMALHREVSVQWLIFFRENPGGRRKEYDTATKLETLKFRRLSNLWYMTWLSKVAASRLSSSNCGAANLLSIKHIIYPLGNQATVHLVEYPYQHHHPIHLGHQDPSRQSQKESRH